MKTSTRMIALKVIRRVHEDAAFAHLALDVELKTAKTDIRDNRFITEMVYGTLRTQGTLDWIISQSADRPLEKLDVEVLDLLRLGTYQLFFMGGVADHAAVNETVEATPIKARGFVNAVLRGILRLKETMDWPPAIDDEALRLSLEYYYPQWLAKIWLERFGLAGAMAVMKAQNEPAPLVVRVNSLKTSVDDVIQDWAGKNISTARCRYAPDAIVLKSGVSIMDPVIQEAIIRGIVQPQSEASVVAVSMLSPKEGETIIDACAAPGTKTAHIAAVMRNDGLVIAVDIHRSRAGLIKESCERLGVKIAKIVVGDAGKLENLFNIQVDRILIDAPCSGLGALHKRPDIRWRIKPDMISRLAETQRQLLNSAASVVRPGGILAYSTCTISEPENEDNAERFLAGHPDFSEEKAPEGLSIEEVRSRIGYQFLPSKHGTEGFYIALFRKRA